MTEQIVPFEPAHYAAARAPWEQMPGVGLSDADEPRAIEQLIAANAGSSASACLRGGWWWSATPHAVQSVTSSA